VWGGGGVRVWGSPDLRDASLNATASMQKNGCSLLAAVAASRECCVVQAESAGFTLQDVGNTNVDPAC
jgi:hypothetical protein